MKRPTARIVEQALRDYPETRNSDKKLIIKVWELQMGKPMNQAYIDFFVNQAMFPDTITRVRRKLQESGRYSASKEVDKQRFKKFQQVKEVAPRTNDPDQLNLV